MYIILYIILYVLSIVIIATILMICIIHHNPICIYIYIHYTHTLCIPIPSLGPRFDPPGARGAFAPGVQGDVGADEGPHRERGNPEPWQIHHFSYGYCHMGGQYIYIYNDNKNKNNNIEYIYIVII